MKLDEFPIPRISHLMAQLYDKKYFSMIDLQDGFFQVNINASDKEKTAFLAGNRLMHFTKMPQGFKNSPAIFQRVMTIILKDLIGKCCINYIDDILIFGKDKKEHDLNFKKVKERIESYGLKENINKRIYCVKNIDFLGYNIEQNIIKPTTNRSQGIIEYPSPNTKKQLQRFIGMMNYDRMFIKNISEKIEILYRLLRKDTKFVWSELEQNVFDNIKKEWTQNLELSIPNLTEKFSLETDASKVGIGGVCRQNGRPVAYISRRLNQAEENYSITERELLAALWCMEKLEFLLAGVEFDLITDHKAIEEVKRKSNFGNNRISRWFSRLERFQFKPIYKSGQELVVADALSRSPPDKNIENSDIKTKILETHKKNNHTTNIKNYKDYKEIGINQTEVKKIIHKCKECQERNNNFKTSCNFVTVEKPGDLVSVDILDMGKGKETILLLDYFTRFAYGRNIKEKESSNVLEFLKKVYKEFPFKQILSDNGREFDNKKITKWLEEEKVHHKFSIPYYHKSNGRIERLNRTIRSGLNKSSIKSFKERLKNCINAYNTSYHRGIGMSPKDAMDKMNWETIKKHEQKYRKEFERKNKILEKLRVGEKVILKKENRRCKNDRLYEEIGVIEGNEYGDVYNIVMSDGRKARRHFSQFKRFQEGDVDN